MKVVFKNSRYIDGVFHSKGLQEVPEKLLKHWFFNALVSEGVVQVLEKPEPKEVAPALVESEVTPSAPEVKPKSKKKNAKEE